MIPEQWRAQMFARTLMRHTMILVTTNLDTETVERSNMLRASTPDEAPAIARSRAPTPAWPLSPTA